MSERERIRQLGERAVEELVRTPPSNAREWGLRMTSGTSATPVLTVLKYGEIQTTKYNRSVNAAACFGALNVRLSNILLFRSGTAGQKRIVALDLQDLPSLGPLFADLSPDTVCGSPSFAVKVGEALATSAASVTLLQLSGERLMPLAHEALAKRFPHAHRLIMMYSANELGSISTQGCGYVPPNHYHPAEGVEVEIEDADETGAGELVITKKDASVAGGLEVEKYRIGDSARFVEKKCPCGANVTFEHLGRQGKDYIKIAGAIIRREEFDRVALLFKNQIDDYRAEASEVVEGGMKGRVVLHIFSSKGVGSSALAEEVARDFARQVYLTPTQTYADLVAKNFFVPLAVVFTPAPFPEKHKSVKLSRVEMRS